MALERSTRLQRIPSLPCTGMQAGRRAARRKD